MHSSICQLKPLLPTMLLRKASTCLPACPTPRKAKAGRVEREAALEAAKAERLERERLQRLERSGSARYAPASRLCLQSVSRQTPGCLLPNGWRGAGCTG